MHLVKYGIQVLLSGLTGYLWLFGGWEGREREEVMGHLLVWHNVISVGKKLYAYISFTDGN